MCLFFLTMMSAEAEEYINFDLQLKQGSSYNYLYFDETIEDENAYYTSSLNENGVGVIRKISKDGTNVLWESENSWGVYVGLEQDDNYIYGLFFETDYENYGSLYIVKIPKETGTFDTHSYIYLDDDSDIYDGDIYYDNGTIYVITKGFIDDEVADNDDFQNYDSLKLYTINASTNDVTTENYADVSKEKIAKITGHEMLFSNFWTDNFPEEYDSIFISNQYNAPDAYYVVGEAKKSGHSYTFIMKTDLNGKVQWIKKSEGNLHYYDISGYSDDYIVVVGYKDDANLGEERNQDSVESYLYVLNPEGEFIESHDVAKEMGIERIDLTHILAYQDKFLLQGFGYDDEHKLSSYVIRYSNNFKENTYVEETPKEIITNDNPKTGLNLPIISGVIALIVASLAYVVIRKRNLFRNI